MGRYWIQWSRKGLQFVWEGVFNSAQNKAKYGSESCPKTPKDFTDFVSNYKLSCEKKKKKTAMDWLKETNPCLFLVSFSIVKVSKFWINSVIRAFADLLNKRENIGNNEELQKISVTAAIRIAGILPGMQI